MPLEFSALDWIIIGLLAMVLLLLLSILFTVTRIERRLASQPHAVATMPESAPEEHSQSMFDQFIAEDPERRKLSKKELFEAFREWKKLRGLTWSS